MKTQLIALVFIFSTSFLSAQDTKFNAKPKSAHELGVNVTNFINNFLSFNERGGAAGTYLISYRNYYTENKAHRMGLNLHYSLIIFSFSRLHSNFLESYLILFVLKNSFFVILCTST